MKRQVQSFISAQKLNKVCVDCAFKTCSNIILTRVCQKQTMQHQPSKTNYKPVQQFVFLFRADTKSVSRTPHETPTK